MNFVAVAIVSAIVPPVKQKSRVLIGLNCILLCLNNSSQISKIAKQNGRFRFPVSLEEADSLP